MTGFQNPTRRGFLGQAAGAAGAIAAGALTTGASGAAIAACTGDGSRPNDAAAKRPARRSVVAENSLPGDRHWQITKLGAPGAIMGYAGQAGVLPGEPIHLYVSTTAREFVVRAYRIGWYNGDLARKVAESG